MNDSLIERRVLMSIHEFLEGSQIPPTLSCSFNRMMLDASQILYRDIVHVFQILLGKTVDLRG